MLPSFESVPQTRDRQHIGCDLQRTPPLKHSRTQATQANRGLEWATSREARGEDGARASVLLPKSVDQERDSVCQNKHGNWKRQDGLYLTSVPCGRTNPQACSIRTEGPEKEGTAGIRGRGVWHRNLE